MDDNEDIEYVEGPFLDWIHEAMKYASGLEEDPRAGEIRLNKPRKDRHWLKLSIYSFVMPNRVRDNYSGTLN